METWLQQVSLLQLSDETHAAHALLDSPKSVLYDNDFFLQALFSFFRPFAWIDYNLIRLSHCFVA